MAERNYIEETSTAVTLITLRSVVMWLKTYSTTDVIKALEDQIVELEAKQKEQETAAKE